MSWVQAFIAGVIIGALFVLVMNRLFGKKNKQRALQAELNNTKKELKSYHADINDHFKRSAILLNNMLKEYQQLYTHFSKASQKLTDVDHRLDENNPFNLVNRPPMTHTEITPDVQEKEKNITIEPVERISSHKIQPRDYPTQAIKPYK